MKKGICVFSMLFVFIIALSSHTFAYTINTFGPDAYLGGTPAELATMEANLGISGALIEDFDDYDLIDGLSVSGPLYCTEHLCWGNTWGDPSTSAFMVYPKLVDTANISLAQGVEMIGFGLGYCEDYSKLQSSVFYAGNYTVMTINNDVAIHLTSTNFPNLIFAVTARNGYITIKRDLGDPLITDLTFHTVVSCGDAFSWDYIALKYPDSPSPEPPGLVANYPFNGNANDESGTGNNGTIHGATPTSDRFGNANSAYYFDGDDYIESTTSQQFKLWHW